MTTARPTAVPAAAAGTITLGGDLTVNRMGFGAMRLTGKGIWGPPKHPASATGRSRNRDSTDVSFSIRSPTHSG